MPRVMGIGGIFFKAKDPDALRAWYSEHLGIEIQPWGGSVFRWRELEIPDRDASTTWSIFPDATTYFAPSQSSFMINYRVEDLDSALADLRQAGCNVDERTDASEYGKFGWVTDPEGNKIELWEPPRLS